MPTDTRDPLQLYAERLLDQLEAHPCATPRAHKLGRNERCWCRSGKKYKRCHWQADQDKGGAFRLRPMSEIIHAICQTVPPPEGGWTQASLEIVANMAGLAWNYSRSPRGQGDAVELAQMLNLPSLEAEQEAVELLTLLLPVARLIDPDDPRSVVRVEAVEKAGQLRILVVTAR